MWFVELVRALAWPITVVVVALAFKSEFLAFIPPMLRRKIELELPGGFKAKIGAAEQQQGGNPTDKKLDENPAIKPSPRAALNLIETRLRGELESMDAARKEPVLLRELAQSRLEMGHEFTYNRIFGSQILALKRLNEVGCATVDDAREFFKPYAEQFPQIYSNYGFDGWLGFLISNSLIVQNGSVLKISDFGRDFLIYLTDRRLTESKPW